MKQQPFKGVFYIALASILWGIAGAVAKVIFNQSITPIELTAVRSLIATLVLFLIIFVLRKPVNISAKVLGFLIVQGFLLSAVNFTFYYSISKTNVAIAIMLEYLAPLFVVIFNFFFKSRISINKNVFLVLCISVVSCFLLVGAYNFNFLKANIVGIFVGILCAISFALYNIWGNVGHRLNIDTLIMTSYSFLISAIFWSCLFSPLNLLSSRYTFSIWIYFIFIGIFATVLPYWIYLEGLKHINAFPATIIGMLDPVSAAIAAFILLGETLDFLQIIGMIGICSNIIFLNRHDRLLSLAESDLESRS